MVRSSKKVRSLAAADIPVGVVGLGLMGRSITACLLAAGHPVVALARNAGMQKSARCEVLALLRQMRGARVLRRDPAKLLDVFTISDDYDSLANCKLVIEAIVEDVETKKGVLARVEQVVSSSAWIGSNTSAIPVSILQEGAKYPQRILGIHWAEPAHVTRFMEIICGKETDIKNAEAVVDLARGWGKEPALLRRDIRGFIANRVMYAMLREAFHLVESGYATIEDVDRSLRNDLGSWITFAGPFRFMDLTGIPAYRAVMKDLFPELSCETRVPQLIEKLVESGARGVSNAKGFYSYTPEEARRWEKLFLRFTYDIRKLSLKFPENVGNENPRQKKNPAKTARSRD